MNTRSKSVISFVAMLAVVFAAAVALALAGCSGSASPSNSSSSSASSASSAAQSSAASQASQSSASLQGSANTTTIKLDYNAGTGYEWVYSADPEGVVSLVSQNSENLAEEGVSGGALQDQFTFKAEAPGEVVLTFDLVRPWETDVEPAETQVYAFTVNDEMQMILNPYKSDFVNEPVS